MTSFVYTRPISLISQILSNVTNPKKCQVGATVNFPLVWKSNSIAGAVERALHRQFWTAKTLTSFFLSTQKLKLLTIVLLTIQSRIVRTFSRNSWIDTFEKDGSQHFGLWSSFDRRQKSLRDWRNDQRSVQFDCKWTHASSHDPHWSTLRGRGAMDCARTEHAFAL